MCKLLHNTGEPLPQDSTEDYLPSTLIEAARELEFDYIACGWRPPLPISAPKITIKSNYPNVWSERYVEAGYIKRDPTISASQKSLRPIACRYLIRTLLKIGSTTSMDWPNTICT